MSLGEDLADLAATTVRHAGHGLDLARALGTVVAERQGSILFTPSHPALADGIVVLRPEGQEVNHVQGRLVAPTPLAELTAHLGSGRSHLSDKRHIDEEVLFEVVPAEPVGATAIADVQGGEVRGIAIRVDRP